MQKSLAFLNVLSLPGLGVRRRTAIRVQGRTQTAVTAWKLWLAFALIGFNLLFIVISIYYVNSNAPSGYILSSLQNKVAALDDQNKKLLVQTTELGSVVQLQQNLAAANYVPAGTAQYVQTPQFTQR